MEVVFTQAALNDLEEIVRYISQDSPRAAERLANDLVNRAVRLAEMPRRGKAMIARPGVRRLVRHPYLIIYRIDEAAGIVHELAIRNRFG